MCRYASDGSAPVHDVLSADHDFAFVQRVTAANGTALVTLPLGAYRVTAIPLSGSAALTVVNPFKLADPNCNPIPQSQLSGIQLLPTSVVEGTAVVADKRPLAAATVEFVPTKCADGDDGGSLHQLFAARRADSHDRRGYLLVAAGPRRVPVARAPRGGQRIAVGRPAAQRHAHGHDHGPSHDGAGPHLRRASAVRSSGGTSRRRTGPGLPERSQWLALPDRRGADRFDGPLRHVPGRGSPVASGGHLVCSGGFRAGAGNRGLIPNGQRSAHRLAGARRALRCP